MPYDEDAFGAAPETQSKAKPSRFLQAIDPTTLEGKPVPQRRWLVGDWVPIARATALYGPGGEGKTTLAQMLATSCAIGKPWLGLATQQCRSVRCFCEAPSAIRR